MPIKRQALQNRWVRSQGPVGFWSGGGGALPQVSRGARVRDPPHLCITGLSAGLQSLGQALGHGEMGSASPEGPLAPLNLL